MTYAAERKQREMRADRVGMSLQLELLVLVIVYAFKITQKTLGWKSFEIFW